MTIEAVLAGKGGEVATVEPGATLAQAAFELARRRIGALVVVDPTGAVVGIVSERDVVQCVAVRGNGALDEPVSDAMTPDVITVTKKDSVLGALSVMTGKRIRHLPVVEGGRLTGIVSIGDLVAFRLARIEAEADAMRAYIQAS